jgi:hypothetical protein
LSISRQPIKIINNSNTIAGLASVSFDTVRLVNFARFEKINGDFRKINVGYLKINGAI